MAAVPHGHWQVTTMVAAIGLGGVVAALTYPGATDADAFATFADAVLGPALRPGDVVVLDNLAAHKAEAVRRAVEARGAVLLFLPPYSPDLNPIELVWSKVKALLRAAAARTFDAVVAAAGAALRAVTPADCDGYFRHCGYDALPS